MRRILLLQDPKSLSKEETWLRKAYANIVSKLLLRALDPASKIDHFSSMFIGFRSIDTDKFPSYQALMEITSYIWSAKGGRGILLEKALAAAGGIHAKRSMPLSLVPQWIATAKNNTEVIEWKMTGSAPNLKFDLVNIIDNRIILLEIKNRVDSGGTSARQEALQKKFLKLCESIQNEEKIFVGDGVEMDIAQTLLMFGIEKIEMHEGFLFDSDGSEATIESDKSNGFYGTSRQLISGYHRNENHRFSTKLSYDESLQHLSFSKDGLAVSVELTYGNDVPRKFTPDHLGLDRALEKVFTRKWDDVWLTLNFAIAQRTMLLQRGTNHLKEIIRIYENSEDNTLRISLRKFIKNPTDLSSLTECIKILKTDNEIMKLPNALSSKDDARDSELADCIFVFATYVKRMKKVKSTQEVGKNGNFVQRNSS